MPPGLLHTLGASQSLSYSHVSFKLLQERRLKRLITLGSLEIGIQHQIVNALELSTTPPPQKKKKKKNNEKLLILVIGLVEKNGRTVKQSSYMKTSSISVPLQSLEAQLSSLSLVTACGCFVDTVSLPCAFRFAPIFMVQSHFQYCWQSI